MLYLNNPSFNSLVNVPTRSVPTRLKLVPKVQASRRQLDTHKYFEQVHDRDGGEGLS